MGKWDKLKGKLPSYEDKDAGYEQFLHELCDKYRADFESYEGLAEALKKLQDEKDELEAQLKTINAHREAVGRVIVERMEEKHITGPVRFDFGLLSLSPVPYPSVVDKEKMHRWLEEHNLEAIIVPTVNWQTLQATIKERMEKGESYTIDGVKLFLKTTVTIKK